MKKFVSNLRRGLEEITLPVWTSFRKSAQPAPLSGKDGIVVSLTTFPARIGKLWIVMDSLFRQTVRPDKIVLVLSEEEFPERMNGIPDSLEAYMHAGLEIVFVPWNMRCHNKYLYSLQAFKDSIVVTVDDDCYYRKDTLERLLELHSKYPDAVCCNIVAIIDPLHFHEYSFWKKSERELPPGRLNLALGFAGVLYPSSMPQPIFNMDLARRLAPTADDLWLKAVELTEGIPVACGTFFPKPVTIKSSQKVSLRSLNKGSLNRNDLQWKALDEYFALEEKI